MPKIGTVLFKDGNYFVEIGGKAEQIPVNPKTDVSHLKQLVGKKVEVLFSEPTSFIAGLVLAEEGHVIKKPKILCYYPVRNFSTMVFEDSARIALAREMLNEGVLSKETFEKIAAPGPELLKKTAV